MTPKIESYKHSMYRVTETSGESELNTSAESQNPIALARPECFELLSAYVDGEATPAERRQVNEWLDNDPQVKSLYLHLLRIRQNLQQMPVPESTEPVSESVDRFFWLLDRRRGRTMAKFGGGAIAALFMVAVSGLIPGMPSASQLAKSFDRKLDSEQLTIALNRPIVPIPKAAVAGPMKQLQQTKLSRNDGKNYDLIYKKERSLKLK